MAERHIQAEILLALGGLHQLCRVWRQNTGKARPLGSPDVVVTYSVPGCADIIGLLCDGRFLALEVKTDDGKQSDQQRRFERMVTSMNGVYAVVRSVDDAVSAVRAAVGGRAA